MTEAVATVAAMSKPKPAGECLRAIRTKREESLRDAAKIVGVSHVAWGEWERGSRTPSEENRRKLHRYSRGAVAPADW